MFNVVSWWKRATTKMTPNGKFQFGAMLSIVGLITIIAIVEWVIYMYPETLLRAVGSIWFG